MSEATAIRILLAGGTGLVGGLLTRQLRQRGDIKLLSLVRTSHMRPDQPQKVPLDFRAVDFEALVADPAGVIAAMEPAPIDVGICCLGTTLAKAGSQAAMWRIDHDYAVAAARAAKAAGARQFILMSSVGAGGSNFYLRMKGEVERDIAALGFARCDMLRPSLLLGDRSERRPAERLWQIAAPLLNPLLLGSLEKYRAIPAETVATAINRLIGAAEPGLHVHEYRELQAAAAG